MKKIVLATVVIVTSALAAINPAFSQKPVNLVEFENDVFVSLQIPSTSENSTANLKAMKHFKKSFASDGDEKWFRVNKGYMAEFKADNTRFRVEYDRKGNWIGTEKGYTGNKLRGNVRAMIKSAYYDYNINWVKEIAVPNALISPVYFVNIESLNSIKNICLYQGELKVIGEYRKG